MLPAMRPLFCLAFAGSITSLIIAGIVVESLWTGTVTSLHSHLPAQKPGLWKGLSSTTVFPEVRTTRTNFRVFQVFSFVTFIASLKGPCLFGLTEQKLAWNLWKGRFWPCWLSGGAGIHSGMCLKATTSSPWDRGASESWDYTGSSSTLTVGQTDQSDPCVTGTGMELIEITLRQ